MKLTDMLIWLISITTSYGYWSFGVYIFDAKFNDPAYFWITVSMPFVALLPAGAFSSLLFNYIEVVKRRFKLDVKTETYHDTVYKLGAGQLIRELLTTTHYKYIIRGQRYLTMTSDVANKYFLDPLKPTINELTMFELCGYHDCNVTLNPDHDYSKSFDELFGYYMQKGLVNKIKYIFKNINRFKIRSY